MQSRPEKLIIDVAENWATFEQRKRDDGFIAGVVPYRFPRPINAASRMSAGSDQPWIIL